MPLLATGGVAATFWLTARLGRPLDGGGLVVTPLQGCCSLSTSGTSKRGPMATACISWRRTDLQLLDHAPRCTRGSSEVATGTLWHVRGPGG